MAGVRMRALAGVALVAVAMGVAGCSDGGGDPSTAVSKAASAVESAGAAVESAASEASDAAASAAAVAKDKLSEVKDGVDAKNEVTLGAPSADGAGHATVPVSVRNTDGSAKSFAVQVNFKDEGGNLLDTVVVTIPDVAPDSTGEGTARSNRSPSGTVKAETGTALRY
ncbi:hypothetical protein [Streptomyces sp. NBC_01264]|uniref:hypothetical protein n=1 Tax=Streptomyces sp. NBC_01264 TaxID=2903804 RepID=UPI00224FB315|nr:hypothetical protein [Streptomyces sp. NBC_01264]MCX4776148.1 hypothetical protein [Streptomyces sp. NBC_01264]